MQRERGRNPRERDCKRRSNCQVFLFYVCKWREGTVGSGLIANNVASPIDPDAPTPKDGCF